MATTKDNGHQLLDQEVLGLLQEGDPQAAERLLEVFGDRVYGLSVRILGNEEDAREAVQETFLTVWRKWPTFKERAKFSSWIYRIAANTAFMKLRKKKKRRGDVSIDRLSEDGALDPLLNQGEGLAATGSQAARTPDQELHQRELRGLIVEAVQALPDIYRTAYVLKDIDGLALKDIAQIMEISEPAAKSRVHRARLELRRRLAPLLEE